ncbi:hypothetical protein EYF80_024110 [Liparis tanakae]|uniref:Uncharacterized protein n=1 Tax=Liparis tanakae TaxID=230148 RepID=A0A4Z2HIR8_9TELE|nr:hypothetical protein EYF80_024110 [Liparis tanakae]
MVPAQSYLSASWPSSTFLLHQSGLDAKRNLTDSGARRLQQLLFLRNLVLGSRTFCPVGSRANVVLFLHLTIHDPCARLSFVLGDDGHVEFLHATFMVEGAEGSCQL